LSIRISGVQATITDLPRGLRRIASLPYSNLT
jgi:hypothetical protein